MSVIIGSARGDEYGHATGGRAGDQKQGGKPDYKGEVSRQSWYLHSKGWTLIRFDSAEVREKIAKDMEAACDNPLIGYDQSENRTLYDVSKPLGFDCAKVKTACETDCAQLVRVCVRYAGIECVDFYTATEAEVLKKTGLCMVSKAKKYTETDKNLLRGDILVTRKKGHTVVVLSNGTDAKEEETHERSYQDATREFQKFMNDNYYGIIGKKLEVDGEYGPKTRAAAVAIFKYMGNKYYAANLTVGNENFLSQCKAVAYLMTDAEIYKHPTLATLIQGILSGRFYYRAAIDGIFGSETAKAVMAFQRDNDIEASGCMTGSTWYKLYN